MKGKCGSQGHGYWEWKGQNSNSQRLEDGAFKSYAMDEAVQIPNNCLPDEQRLAVAHSTNFREANVIADKVNCMTYGIHVFDNVLSFCSTVFLADLMGVSTPRVVPLFAWPYS
ncbi:hypothetical protein VNO78_20183 [Psophocarpus tetragonolobus]|uniref:Uncharacterized protein n=1 Tax=Psophocarpus tetragonolobus TaxID=3891 RepID=A0AAN9XGH8_PSOTE